MAAVLFSGCAAVPPAAIMKPATLYEASLVNTANNQPATPAALATQLAGADVIVIGEYHGHQAAHLLQSRLQAALHRIRPEQVLALEAFDVDRQAVIDDYLAGKLGEDELIEDAAAWDNYKASYRPLLEFARHRQAPVIAANAPADVVRCVGRHGPEYLDSLSPSRRALLPESPFRDVPGYREKFFDRLGHNAHGEESGATRSRLENAYQAQLLRDNTMADQVLRSLQDYPGYQVLMVTGTFHSEQRLGITAILEQRAPGLEVVVISPVILTDDDQAPAPAAYRDQGDYIYFIQPLPERFLDEQRRNAAIKHQFSKARQQECR
ncbi:ChaN family lipoprotein [Marinobacter sp.]